VQDAERAMLYAAVFVLGLWCCNLAGRRMLLPLAVVAATGAAIGIVTTVTLASGNDVTSYVHSDATLRFPIGYRNAEAAFLMICLWPTIVLAAESGLAWQPPGAAGRQRDDAARAGRGRREPGVAAGGCRRPDDLPRALAAPTRGRRPS